MQNRNMTIAWKYFEKHKILILNKLKQVSPIVCWQDNSERQLFDKNSPNLPMSRNPSVIL